MNILIPHKWLQEHLDTTIEPKELQKLVSLSGPSVERIYEREEDSVYDVEITTNRVDSMSIRGFAREAAVILSQYDASARLKKLTDDFESTTKQTTQETLPLPKINDNPTLNNRTICIVLDGVERSATPDWMTTRLSQTEMNVHDAAIDITNYVTHELGHPCHAFDYDKIMTMGAEINIVEAEPEESFTTLDGATYQTKGGEVVFKNGSGEIIDLPSIKGTKNTSVDDSTKRILLLAESIRSDKVRYASMTHAIRTTAAQLLEKNLDPNLATETIALAVRLYRDICNAQVASPVHDSYTIDSIKTKFSENQSVIILNSTEITRYLGISLPAEKVVSILEQLGCLVTLEQSEPQSLQYAVQVTPPSFRSDLHIPADLVEEIARIYGYHNLPSTLPNTAIPTNYQKNTDFGLEHQLKQFLAATGWQEVYTYSMVSEEIAQQSGYEIDSHLAVSNPLTEDMTYLRQTLLPSISAVIDSNPTVRPLSLFEFATIYQPLPDKNKVTVPKQPLHIGMVSTGEYRALKGSIEALLDTLYVDTTNNLTVNQDTPAKPGFEQSGTLTVNILNSNKKVTIGTIGIIRIVDSINSQNLVAAELDWNSVLSVIQRNPVYQPLPKTSIVTEDLTITVPEKTEVGAIIQTIKSVDSLITQVEYLNQYQQNMSFRLTYYNPNTNLSGQDIEPIRTAVIAKVTEMHQAQLVGAV